MLYIHGIGHFHPENIISNQFLEDLAIDTTADWIIERTGILERHTILSLEYIQKTKNKQPHIAHQYAQYSNVETAIKATRFALHRAKLKPTQIGMVISGSSLPQLALPAESCAIAGELNIDGVAFDLNSGCSTFSAQVHFINQLTPENTPDFILLVIPENFTRAVDFSDRSTAVLFGDASTAMIVSKKIPSPVRIRHTFQASDPKHWHLIQTPFAGFFIQEGSAVQRFAIKKSVAIIQKIRELAGIQQDKHYFIGHQSNFLALNSICQLAGIAQDKHFYNVNSYGNCTASGAPSVLSERWDHLRHGDKIIFAVVGAGLSWGGMLIEMNNEN